MSIIGRLFRREKVEKSPVTEPEGIRTSLHLEVDEKSINDADACYDRGSQKAEAGDPKGAIAEFTKAIKLKPNHPLAYGSRGFAYGMMGKYRQAIEDLTKDIQLRPNIAVTYFYRAECRQRQTTICCDRRNRIPASKPGNDPHREQTAKARDDEVESGS